jgi:PPM family protein phosphatase
MSSKPDPERTQEVGRRLTFAWSGKTVRGLVRTNNEDNLWAHPVGQAEAHEGDAQGRASSLWSGLLFCAADGMGGALAGEVASGLAVSVVASEMAQRVQGASELAGTDGLTRLLSAAVETAHAAIRRESEANPQRRGMGTTLTATWIVGDEMVVAQVGDSRAYLFRGGHLKQLTKDQSLVGKLIEDGVITEEEAERIAGKNIILQALGTEEPLDVVAERQRVSVGDLLLLCSDGLCGVVSNKEIEDDLRRGGAPAEVVERLIALAEKKGGPDNITVVVAKAER